MNSDWWWFVALLAVAFLAFLVRLGRRRLGPPKKRAPVQQDWMLRAVVGIMFGMMAYREWYKRQIDSSDWQLTLVYALVFIGLAVRDFWKRREKFTIAGILIFTAVIAVYCGVMRWIGPDSDSAFPLTVIAFSLFIAARQWQLHCAKVAADRRAKNDELVAARAQQVIDRTQPEINCDKAISKP